MNPNRLLAWFVLLISLLITATLTLHLKSNVDKADEHDFFFRSNEIHHRISTRLDDYARILQGGAALFLASDLVTREEWRIFTYSQKLEKQLPGIQAISFARLIPRAELARHIQEVRNEGFPEYQVQPEGIRDFYAPVVYIEPFSGRNVRVFGYDTLSEPVRRDAMERARDTDSPALSGKILLVQETGVDVQAGAIMFVPVFQKGMPITTPEQRRAAIYGWVASPYRMKTLLQGILNIEELERDLIHLAIFDGDSPTPQAQLFECHSPHANTLMSGKRFSRRSTLDFNGHRWTLSFTKSNGGLFAPEYTEVWITLIGCTIISILLFILINTLLNTRIQAQLIAKELTHDLENSLDRHRSILQTAMDGFWLTDTQGHILECNETYCRMSGYTEQELLTLKVHDLEATENTSEASSHILEVIAQGETRFESRHRRKNGTIYDVEVSVQYRAEDGGRLVAFIKDITERKRTEAELQKAQKLQSVGTLAGGIAHDFNNIMMGLFGNISLAKNEISRDHPSFTPLEDAEKSMSRAIRLTKQLLTFSKGGEPVIEDVSLGSLVEEVAHFDLTGSNVMLVHEQSPDLWIAKVDKGQIQQVISNLTTNARQAMPNGGHLYINLENVIIDGDAMPKLKPGKYIKVTVRDEGTGIDPKTIDRIFDPYFTTKQSGSGLGLATTYSIITKHGGHISVASQMGKGTQFTFFLPASDKAPRPPSESGNGTLSPFVPGPRVLILDDEEYVLKVIPRWLAQMGCSTETAADGHEAIELYKNALEVGTPFDVLILDLTIPGGIGGVEVLKSLIPINPSVKAIASSGYANGSQMSKHTFYGFKGVLAKPYTKQQLHDALSQVLK